ncbi:putative uncharacterized protein DDB_G0283431 [Camellia sinensis]|uniref:putative uncharacterized protein DDB_G0283431 n=1 Tax=Camellia sinensis TaxID=4442 RepID=UPI0010364074|nr:putative uncharacterized protein DDB_G0283431 [Camellia sinensis]
MKTIIILLLVVSALLCLQANGRRSILEEGKKEKANNPNNYPGKSSTYGNSNSAISVPTVDSNNNENNNDVNNNDNDNNSTDDNADEKNNSYGNYSNASGSSTDTHHVYPDDCRPPH